MAHFAGDIGKDGQPLKAKGFGENFWYDLTGQEDKCVWKNRGELEKYFIVVGVVFCWTIIVPIAKLRLLISSLGKKDHR